MARFRLAAGRRVDVVGDTSEFTRPEPTGRPGVERAYETVPLKLRSLRRRLDRPASACLGALAVALALALALSEPTNPRTLDARVELAQEGQEGFDDVDPGLHGINEYLFLGFVDGRSGEPLQANFL
jgi:hypothetical protein